MAAASLHTEPSTESPATRNPDWRYWTLGIVVVLVAGVLGGYALFSPGSHAPVATAQMEQGCDLRAGPCTASFVGGAAVGLRIGPAGIPVSEPLTVAVTTEGLAADKVEVDFQGVDMNMGFNRVTLDRAGGDLFSAAAILPVCIRGGMAWRATVTLDTGNGPYVATFLFDTRAGR